MELDIDKHLVLVEARQELYDFTLKDHHNKVVIDRYWEYLTKEMNSRSCEEHNRLALSCYDEEQKRSLGYYFKDKVTDL
ncbi:unnamed protein product [Timema podura]|uniref:Uncharacterized protein n=1 Tax=Timema podura TaxID=61482 RepID=A0ABN7P749_TIMPD|nr:unnamed protein product [Timema podura]